MDSTTPLMRQYADIKAQYLDCILLFRMGDFYELFNDDAVIASQILGLTLTKRNNGSSGQTPLCGFPHHAVERYIPKLIGAGYKAAICEQVEDPKDAKGIVKREVIEVITAGTSMNEGVLEDKSNHYLAGITMDNREKLALAILDISTGQFRVTYGNWEEICSELFRLQPRELLYNKSEAEFLDEMLRLFRAESVTLSPVSAGEYDEVACRELLRRQFNIHASVEIPYERESVMVQAAGSVLSYALAQKKNSLDHLHHIEEYSLKEYMALDAQTLRNLEIIKPMHSDDHRSTLLWVLDQTQTAMGGRLLREWLTHPLLKKTGILKRQACVAELCNRPDHIDNLREILKEIADLERLIAKVGAERANARDLQALGKSLELLAPLAEAVQNLQSEWWPELKKPMENCAGKGRIILHHLNDDVPLSLREGGLIRSGADEELDAVNEGIRDAREWLAGLEKRERERLGISTLKVGYNRVFGYYIEITRQHADKIPQDYIRKQTLSGAERYISPEMKEYETRILTAESRIHEMEYQIFCKLRKTVKEWMEEILQAASAVAVSDTLCALAKTAREQNYCCPEISEDAHLDIEGGFHPVIAAHTLEQGFITNDLMMNPDHNQIMLITGPNMAGKSTYLRQNGLIVLMAQTGGFVPASQARIGLCDRIFTRVGASDRLARGQSTFMVEMVETAHILHNATSRSLILLDEIGRGTSTFDGLSLAWAIVEYLHNQPGKNGKTLFATHYHELTDLVKSLERVKNYQISVKEKNGVLVFLRKILEGACDSSYGIQVAAMAGLPEDVILRAKRILHRLEKNRTIPSDEQFKTPAPVLQQSLFEAPPLNENEQLVLADIARISINDVTPMQALNLLAQFKKQLKP